MIVVMTVVVAAAVVVVVLGVYRGQLYHLLRLSQEQQELAGEHP